MYAEEEGCNNIYPGVRSKQSPCAVIVTVTFSLFSKPVSHPSNMAVVFFSRTGWFTYIIVSDADCTDLNPLIEYPADTRPSPFSQNALAVALLLGFTWTDSLTIYDDS